MAEIKTARGKHVSDPGAHTGATSSESVPDKPSDVPKSGWIAVLRRSLREFKHDDVTDRAAALTYFGVLAIFPAMLVLIAILGLLGRSTTQKLLDNLGAIAPGGVKTFLTTVIKQVQGGAGRRGSPRSSGSLSPCGRHRAM